MGGGAGAALRRIPRIKFPQRHNNHPNSSSAAAPAPAPTGAAAQPASTKTHNVTQTSEVPAPPRNVAMGGQASLQPKRTPVSQREIEAVLLGGAYDV